MPINTGIANITAIIPPIASADSPIDNRTIFACSNDLRTF